MRETIGTTWTFQIMITLILIFSGFLILVINYYRAYIVKNEALKIIEKYDGMTDYTRETLNKYLKESGYKQKDNCPTEYGWNGVYNYDDNRKHQVIAGKKYYYCYREIADNNNSINHDKNDNLYYSDVIFFYNFNLPIFGDFMTYEVKGRTNDYKNGR